MLQGPSIKVQPAMNGMDRHAIIGARMAQVMRGSGGSVCGDAATDAGKYRQPVCTCTYNHEKSDCGSFHTHSRTNHRALWCG